MDVVARERTVSILICMCFILHNQDRASVMGQLFVCGIRKLLGLLASNYVDMWINIQVLVGHISGIYTGAIG